MVYEDRHDESMALVWVSGFVTRGPRTLKISWESPNIGWRTGGPDGMS